MSAVTATSNAPAEQAPVVEEKAGVWSYAKDYGRRLRGGELGSLPAVAGLVVLCLVFSIARPRFFTPLNFANLLTQAAPLMMIAMGLVFVLLLGEIDLSAGFASGVCAAVLAKSLAEWGMPWYVASLMAIATGIVIGAIIGFLVAKIGIPSFVVTLAGFLVFQGVVLTLLKEGTNISIRDTVILGIQKANMSEAMGWAFAAIVILGYAAVQLYSLVNRRKRGLVTVPWPIVALRVGGLAALTIYAVDTLNVNRAVALGDLRGVPNVVPVIASLLVIWTFVLRRTKFGRHIYAVGGNREAARRAGINVDLIRISAFVICSAMAAVGGIVAASEAASVDPNTGGSTVLLYAVGAAVIGGTSLFGGKGRVIDAVLGALVIAVIINGMGLVDWKAGVKFIITGGVLLLAASVDALTRRRAAASR
ncbi:sugar ABC transporter permease [Catellatospora tritici]|uniref:sugar ABC transporter permease n=1 Tax=Catellatospora tritici TaxID=2851566 RepID=UPI001C2DAE5E|nr:ABC transporter permease [Catellatospora tritici]MBV1849734.1 ABC transporter permease [Catellatospora tritici]